MSSSLDVSASIALALALAIILCTHAVASLAAGQVLTAPRVSREEALPLVGKAPMHAVYRALIPIGRGLSALGFTANAVSLSALFFAALAAVAFANGAFGVAALVAAIASLADGLDGIVARLTGTESRFGQVLDTMIDRYVDALFLGGIALFVRRDGVLLAVTLAAMVSSFSVSYASSIERELGVVGTPSVMRRAHRLTYLVAASACAPLFGQAWGDPRANLVPVFTALGAIAVFGNVSAVRRILAAGRKSAAASAPRSLPLPVAVDPQPTLDTVETPGE